MPDCKIYSTSGDLLYSFTASRETKIGRSTSCDICLKGLCDETVSREQLIITHTRDGWVVKNIGHSHLYFNGNETEEMPIADGMVFRFSSYFLTIGSKSGPSPFEMTWDVETENNQHRAVLWYGVNTLGASRDNYVVIKNEDIERQHAKVSVNDNDEVFIEPIGIGRYVGVNEVEIKGGVSEIKEEDEIILGDETRVNLIRGIRQKNKLSMAQISGGISPEDAARRNEVKNIAKNPLSWIAALLVVILLILLLFIMFAQSIYNMLFA